MEAKTTISLIKACAIAAGIGKITYNELKRPNSPLREVVLNQVARSIGYPEGNQGQIDIFLFQLPGRLRTAGVVADVLAEPGIPWTGRDIVQPSLVELTDPEKATAFYLEAKPADVRSLSGLYVVREHGDPIQHLYIPGRNGSQDFATVRFFLAGRMHIPPSLQIVP